LHLLLALFLLLLDNSALCSFPQFSQALELWSLGAYKLDWTYMSTYSGKEYICLFGRVNFPLLMGTMHQQTPEMGKGKANDKKGFSTP
jgi:hypothetical protein